MAESCGIGAIKTLLDKTAIPVYINKNENTEWRF